MCREAYRSRRRGGSIVSVAAVMPEATFAGFIFQKPAPASQQRCGIMRLEQEAMDVLLESEVQVQAWSGGFRPCDLYAATSGGSMPKFW